MEERKTCMEELGNILEPSKTFVDPDGKGLPQILFTKQTAVEQLKG